MQEMLQFIEKVGFPAFICIVLAYLLLQYKKSVENLSTGITQLIATIQGFQKALLEEFRTMDERIRKVIREELDRK